MGFSIEMLNSIRNEASAEYQSRIPEATQENISTIGYALQNYPQLFNEFSPLLLNKIGKTILEDNLFENDLARFKTGAITNQQDVEEIFVQMAKAEGAYDPNGPNPLGRRDGVPDKVIYHRQNRQDVYTITLGDLDFLRVFRSESTLDNYLTAKLSSVYSGANRDEWLVMKNLLGTYDGFCDYQVPEITATTAESASKAFVKAVRKASLDLRFLSDQYNKAGVETVTKPANMVLFVHKDVLAEVDVEVLSKAFNMGKTDIQVEIVPLDDFGSMTDTYGLLVDRNWFRVYDTLSHMEPQRNAQGLFTNYFYHVHQIVSCSTFKNAVRFTTAAPAA